MEPKRTIRNRRYDEAFKRNAVSLLAHQNTTLQSVAKDLGIAPITLRNWKARYLGSADAPAGLRLQDLERENLRLRQHNTQLEDRVIILKKACGILSDEPTKGMRI